MKNQAKTAEHKTEEDRQLPSRRKVAPSHDRAHKAGNQETFDREPKRPPLAQVIEQ